MARRRMVSRDIVDTDKFLTMPVSARCCYYDLLVRADDEGFVGNPKSLLKMLSYAEDDLNLLCAKGFVIPFESGVIVITHWKMQNSIAADRFKPTIHREEKFMLGIKGNKEYVFLPERKALLDCTALN